MVIAGNMGMDVRADETSGEVSAISSTVDVNESEMVSEGGTSSLESSEEVLLESQVEEVSDFESSSSVEENGAEATFTEKMTPQPFAGGSVSVEVTDITTSIKTYDTPSINGAAAIPADSLSIQLKVVVDQDNLEDAVIKIPQSFITNATDYPNFSSEYQNKPFFIFEGMYTLENSMFEGSPVVDGENNLVIRIKDGQGKGDETLTLKYQFNTEDFVSPLGFGVIPVETVLWNVEPEVHIQGALVNKVTSSSPVKATNGNKMTNGTTLGIPNKLDGYTGGDISFYIGFKNHQYFSHDFDPNGTNYLYVDLPEGSTPGALISRDYEKQAGVITDDEGNRYERYIMKMENTTETFTHFNISASDWGVAAYNTTYVFTPPADLDIGDKIPVKWGAMVQRYGETEPSQEAELRNLYTKIELPDWDLYTKEGKGFFGLSSSLNPQVMVFYDEPEALSESALLLNWTTSNSLNIVKNQGGADVTGVKQTIYQTSTGSNKANFGRAILYTSKETNEQVWTQYRIEYVITNAVSGTTRMENSGLLSPTLNSTRQMFELELPILNDGEYISEMTLVPMGVDGLTEGNLSPGNGFGINFFFKSFGTEWPDGAPVTGQVISALGSTLYYNDADGLPAEKEYVNPGVISQYKNTVSATTAYSYGGGTVTPGSSIAVVLEGKNDSLRAVGAWKNPRIGLKVPEGLTLKTDEVIELIDSKDSSKNVTVQVREVQIEGGYRYYELIASGYSAAPSTGTVFQIPLTFEVGKTVAAQTLTVDTMVISSEDASQFTQEGTKKMNTLSAAEALKYGYASGENYYVSQSAFSVVVTSQGKLSAVVESRTATEANAETEDDWSKDPVIGAAKEDTVQIRLTLNNDGNTTYQNVRLYALLPFDDDRFESSGSVEFLGVTGVDGASVKFGTVDDAVTFSGINLQDGATVANFAGWSNTIPEEETTKAMYVDFGSAEIKPGESLQVVLNFKIPDAEKQTAYTQFAYSGIQKEIAGDKGTTLTSQIIGFSTEMVSVVYNGNKPANYPVAGVNVEGMTTLTTQSQTILAGDENSKVITLHEGEPTLVGYTFSGWRTVATIEEPKEGEEAKPYSVYNPGDTVTFTEGATVNLYAIWTADDVKITLNGNGGSPTQREITGKFGESIAATGLKPLPKREGYIFTGWNTVANGTGTSFVGYEVNEKGEKTTEGTILAGDTILYAQWIYGYTLEAEGFGIHPNDVADLTEALIIEYAGAIAKQDVDPSITATVVIDDEKSEEIKAEEGFYEITFKTTDAGYPIEKKIVVVVSERILEGEYPSAVGKAFVYAQDFTMTLAQAKEALTKDEGYLTASKAIGANLESKQEITEDIVITGNPQADEEGNYTQGTYLVTYTVTIPIDETTSDVATITKKVSITKDGGPVPSSATEYLDVVNFTVSNTFMEGNPGVEEYVAASGAKAWLTDGTNDAVKITKAMTTATSTLGTYNITFETENGTKKTVTITVVDDQEKIRGTDFVLSPTQVSKDLDGSAPIDYIDAGNVEVWMLNQSGEEVLFEKEKITADASAVLAGYGTYPVAYSTTTMPEEKRAAKTLYATVAEVAGEKDAIGAHGFEVSAYQVKNLDLEAYKRETGVKVWSREKETLNQEVEYTIDYSEVQEVPGEYWIKITSVHGTEYKVKVTVVVNGATLITFDGNGADIEATPRSIQMLEPTVALPSLPEENPVRTGYHFVEWNSKADGTGNKVNVGDIYTENTTVYAKWEVNYYTVIFDVQEGVGNPSEQKVAFDQLLVEPSAPSKEEYRFLGWYTEANSGTKWNFETQKMPARDMVLYAQYGKVQFMREEPSLYGGEDRSSRNKEEELQVESSHYWVKTASVYHKAKPGEIWEVTPENYEDGGRLVSKGEIPEDAGYSYLVNVTVGKYVYMNPVILDQVRTSTAGGQMVAYLEGRQISINHADFATNPNRSFEPKGYFDLRMSVENREEITSLVGDQSQMQLHFEMNRAWMAEPYFTLKVNEELKEAAEKGSTLYMFHYNREKSELELVGPMIPVNNGNYRIQMKGVYGDYVILAKLPSGANYKITDKTNTLGTGILEEIGKNYVENGKASTVQEGLDAANGTLQRITTDEVFDSLKEYEASTGNKISTVSTINLPLIIGGIGVGISLPFLFFLWKKKKEENDH